MNRNEDQALITELLEAARFSLLKEEGASNFQKVKDILDVRPDLINSTDQTNKFTLLHWAAHLGHKPLFDYLLTIPGLDVNVKIDTPTTNKLLHGCTPLDLIKLDLVNALEPAKIYMTEKLVERGATFDEGRLHAHEKELERKREIAKRDEEERKIKAKQTPPQAKLTQSTPPVKKAVIKEKRKFASISEELLWEARMEKDHRRCYEILKENPDLINATDINGYSCLHWAVHHGDMKFVNDLIDKKFVKNLIDRHKYPNVNLNLTVVEPNNSITHGCTPLDLIALDLVPASAHQKPIEQMLIEHGATYGRYKPPQQPTTRGNPWSKINIVDNLKKIKKMFTPKSTSNYIFKDDENTVDLPETDIKRRSSSTSKQ